MDKRADILTLQVVIGIVIGVIALVIVLNTLDLVKELFIPEQQVSEAALVSYDRLNNALQSCNELKDPDNCLACDEINIFLPEGYSLILAKPYSGTQVELHQNEELVYDYVNYYETPLHENSLQIFEGAGQYVVYATQSSFYITDKEGTSQTENSEIPECIGKIRDFSTGSLIDCNNINPVDSESILLDRLKDYEKYIEEASSKYSMPKELIKTIIIQESSGIWYTVGRDGEVGLTQLSRRNRDKVCGFTKIFEGPKDCDACGKDYGDRLRQAVESYDEKDPRILSRELDQGFDPRANIMCSAKLVDSICKRVEQLTNGDCYTEHLEMVFSLYNHGLNLNRLQCTGEGELKECRYVVPNTDYVQEVCGKFSAIKRESEILEA